MKSNAHESIAYVVKLVFCPEKGPVGEKAADEE